MRLIVNADDFGLTPGVNRGVIECFRRGSVSSASLMVTQPAAGEAAELAKSHGALGVGLHFNLTLGSPAAGAQKVPGLVDQGGVFLYRGALIGRSLLVGLKRREIERELLAQVARFHSFGLAMTHVDSHQHVHLIPQVFDVVAGYCSAHNIPLRVSYVWEGGRRKVSAERRLKRHVMKRVVRRNAGAWEGRLRSNSALASVFDFVRSPGEICEGVYRGILAEAKGSPLEIMVHPAHADDTLRSLTRIAEYSDAERKVLSGFSLGELAGSLGWSLGTWSEAF